MESTRDREQSEVFLLSGINALSKIAMMISAAVELLGGTYFAIVIKFRQSSANAVRNEGSSCI